ncbi:DUF485 domain-containing protein [Amycolatopsis sp. DSM 110486]|uniref:DUF485 domain-containing protein n=1 Tax=Amycolatopsis sp. DSM 110486 TaxID=2865832 RepID=UPI001C6A33D5|nr:DUF485 domain-containing protein [Amycolatopsis sp. DSM 110486]QYN24303.1 DUF485 domain-containing protein [Amycolatopsis sp. DSM 110486]
MERTEADVDWEHVQATPEFQQLRRRRRGFVFPMSATFLAWYLLYVLLADYAHAFMSAHLWGNITVGLVLGLAQFLTTFVVTALYVRFANRKLDPLAAELRAEYGG